MTTNRFETFIEGGKPVQRWVNPPGWCSTCNTSPCRGRKSNDPVDCSCSEPKPNVWGQCADCKRLVITPEVEAAAAAFRAR